MKNIMIITSKSEKTVAWKERERYVAEFAASVQKRLNDVTVMYTTYDEIEYRVMDGVCTIRDTKNDIDMSQLDFVQFKNWAYSWGDASVVAHYLAERHVPFVNPEADIALAPGKMAQMFLMGGAGLPVPDTFFARKKRLQSMFESGTLPDGFDFPIIMKANDGSRGDDNHLVRSFEQGRDILTAAPVEKEYVLQSFIPNDGDFRILHVGSEMAPLVFKRSAVEGSHLNNTSKGGSGEFQDASSLPEIYLKHARMAAKLLKREVGGVDIIVNRETGEPYILEVNGTPALATGYGVPEKTAKFAEFAQEVLAGNVATGQSVVGRAEHVRLLEHDDVMALPAKVDTGADMSSVWASDVRESADGLSFKLFGAGCEWYTGKVITVAKGSYRRTRIANSFGDHQPRYVVKLRVNLAGRTVRTSFSLADRSNKTYPILLGRRLLRGKFMVDVTKGTPLLSKERANRERLRIALKNNEV